MLKSNSSKYQKLVRDKIPEIIKENGETPIVRELNKAEFRRELLKKLVEESNEIQSASNKEELIKEMGDAIEVMMAIFKEFDLKEEDVKRIREERKEKRGGFGKKIFLEGVE